MYQVCIVTFSPDGQMLASESFYADIQLYDMDDRSWVKRACGRVGRNLTWQE